MNEKPGTDPILDAAHTVIQAACPKVVVKIVFERLQDRVGIYRITGAQKEAILVRSQAMHLSTAKKQFTDAYYRALGAGIIR